MQLSQIRGTQIKNGSILGSHIKDSQITGSHLDQSAIQKVLQDKLVVDYVQLSAPLVLTEAATSSVIDITNKNSVAADDTTTLGVLLGKRIIIRNADTGEVLYNEAEGHKHEVYGRLTFAEDVYTIEFGCYEEDGSFTVFEVPAGTKLDVQYAQRFNLANVDEMFAANEKFVDGAVDVTTALKLKELEAQLEALDGQIGDEVDALRTELEAQIEAVKTMIGVASSEGVAATGIIADIEDLQEKVTDIHYHRSLLIQIDDTFTGSSIVLPAQSFAKLSVEIEGSTNMFEMGVNVYVNGILQALNINYSEEALEGSEGYCGAILFEEDSIIEGDVILLEWEYKEKDITIV